MHFDATSVCKPIGVVSIGQKEMPYTTRVDGHRMRAAIPAVKVADKRKSLCPGCPFAIPNPGLTVIFPAIETEILVSLAYFT